MKVPINDYDCVNLESPTIAAYEAKIGSSERWIMWCKYCKSWHDHGPGEGHREALQSRHAISEDGIQSCEVIAM